MSDYGFAKLAELFESIPETVEVNFQIIDHFFKYLRVRIITIKINREYVMNKLNFIERNPKLLQLISFHHMERS